jgi:hypothetical protein
MTVVVLNCDFHLHKLGGGVGNERQARMLGAETVEVEQVMLLAGLQRSHRLLQ